MTQPVSVSAVILTYNEEKNIATCLRSIAGWCQEILVVDSGSTDATQAICHKYTDKTYIHPYVDHASQWDWTLKALPFACEWIMPLDADHVVTDSLKRDIADVMLNPNLDIDGYYSRHRYFFWGVPIRGFKPYSLRLFRRSKTRVDPSELVDFRFEVEGKTKKLSGVLQESNQNELSIDFWIDKHQKFSSRVAVEEVLRASGYMDWSIRPRLCGNPDERVIWLKNCWYRLPLYVRPFLYYFYRYILRLGCLDGWTGFIYHFLQAFWYRFMIDIKIAEIRQQLARGQVSLTQLEKMFAGSR